MVILCVYLMCVPDDARFQKCRYYMEVDGSMFVLCS